MKKERRENAIECSGTPTPSCLGGTSCGALPISGCSGSGRGVGKCPLQSCTSPLQSVPGRTCSECSTLAACCGRWSTCQCRQECPISTAPPRWEGGRGWGRVGREHLSVAPKNRKSRTWAQQGKGQGEGEGRWPCCASAHLHFFNSKRGLGAAAGALAVAPPPAAASEVLPVVGAEAELASAPLPGAAAAGSWEEEDIVLPSPRDWCELRAGVLHR